MTVASLPAAGCRPDRLILLDPPALRMDDLVALSEDPTEQRYDDLAGAIAVIRSSGVGWSQGDIRAKAIALTQFDSAAARAVYLENGEWDAGLAALSDPATEAIPTWIIRGEPAHGGLTADKEFAALTDRVGPDHVMTLAGGPHSPQRTNLEATVLAILRALA